MFPQKIPFKFVIISLLIGLSIFGLTFYSFFKNLEDIKPANAASSGLKEVYPGNNVIGSDRINIVVVNDGFPSESGFLGAVKKLYMFDGDPKLLNANGDIVTSGGNRLSFGFFAIEPNKSNRNKFNIWWLNKSEVADYATPDCGINPKLRAQYPTLTKYSVLTRLIYGQNSSWGANACLNINNNSQYSNRNQISYDFSAATMYYPGNMDRKFLPDILAHETSHQLYSLLDEYPSNILPKLGQPNAAVNQTQAQTYWSNFIGQVDPFYYQWKALLQAKGFTAPPENDFKVGYFSSGCLASTGTCIIPTTKSLMNYLFSNQVYGSVNRDRVEKTLALFSGVQLTSSSASSSSAISCPGGQILNGISCQTQCLPGQYFATNTCVDCGPGTYKSVSGNSQSLCVDCPLGTTSVSGTQNISSCIKRTSSSSISSSQWGISSSNSSQTVNFNPLLIEQKDIIFNPSKKDSKIFAKVSDFSISILDSRISSGASCNFFLAKYPKKESPASNFALVNQAPIIKSSSLEILFPQNLAIQAKWRYRIECQNPSNSNNGYISTKFTGFADYSFKYGAISKVEATASGQ